MLFRRPYQTLLMKKASPASFAPGSILIDIRDAEEFAGGHITGAVSVPIETLPTWIREAGSRSVPIYVCCQSGKRSPAACRLLCQNGFTCVTNLAGGLDRWAGTLKHDIG